MPVPFDRHGSYKLRTFSDDRPPGVEITPGEVARAEPYAGSARPVATRSPEPTTTKCRGCGVPISSLTTTWRCPACQLKQAPAPAPGSGFWADHPPDRPFGA